jgi:hypothetical protein
LHTLAPSRSRLCSRRLPHPSPPATIPAVLTTLPTRRSARAPAPATRTTPSCAQTPRHPPALAREKNGYRKPRRHRVQCHSLQAQRRQPTSIQRPRPASRQLPSTTSRPQHPQKHGSLDRTLRNSKRSGSFLFFLFSTEGAMLMDRWIQKSTTAIERKKTIELVLPSMRLNATSSTASTPGRRPQERHRLPLLRHLCRSFWARSPRDSSRLWPRSDAPQGPKTPTNAKLKLLATSTRLSPLAPPAASPQEPSTVHGNTAAVPSCTVCASGPLGDTTLPSRPQVAALFGGASTVRGYSASPTSPSDSCPKPLGALPVRALDSGHVPSAKRRPPP